MELMEIINTRRAYRSLQPVAIDEDMVRDLATAASLSASCFNNQPWRFVFAFDKEVLGRLQASHEQGQCLDPGRLPDHRRLQPQGPRLRGQGAGNTTCSTPAWPPPS